MSTEMRDGDPRPAPAQARTRRFYTGTWTEAATALFITAAGGLVVGGLTSPAQGFLPPWINSLSNSAGGWTMLSFLILWLSRARPLPAVLLGIVTFEALNEGYGIVSAWRGHFYAEPFSTVWSLIGFAAGPVLGAAAAVVRYGPPRWRALGVTPLSAVLLGEGVGALFAQDRETPPTYWLIEIALSVLFMALGLVLTRSGRLPSLVAVSTWLLGSAAYLGCYLLLVR